VCFIVHGVLCIVFKCDHSRNVRARGHCHRALFFFGPNKSMHPMPCTYNGRTFPVLCVSVSVKAIYQWPALSIDARVALHEKHLSINSVVSATKDPFFTILTQRHCVFVAFLRKYPFSPRKKSRMGVSCRRLWPFDQPLSPFSILFYFAMSARHRRLAANTIRSVILCCMGVSQNKGSPPGCACQQWWRSSQKIKQLQRTL
jgi:hypothetical protein